MAVVGTHDGSGVADLSNCFQIENCAKLFEACYKILHQKLQKKTYFPSHSLLGLIVRAKDLGAKRRKFQRKASAIDDMLGAAGRKTSPYSKNHQQLRKSLEKKYFVGDEETGLPAM